MLNKSDIESIVLLALTIDYPNFTYPSLSTREYLSLERELRIFGFSSVCELMATDSSDIMNKLSVSEELIIKAKNCLKEVDLLLIYLDELVGKGIKIINKFDKSFPHFLKQKSRNKSSLYLYCSGALENLIKGIRISGLTSVQNDEMESVERLILKIKRENKPYVTICEKGINLTGLNLAIKHNLNVVLIAYKNYYELLQTYQKQLRDKKMVIISQFKPDTSYDPTNEIVSDGLSSKFCDFRIVVSCKINSGLTWFNAIQNLNFKWTRIFVINNECLGNQKLLTYDYVKLCQADFTSEYSFESIYEKNRSLCIVDFEQFTQMSIFDFIPGGFEDEKISTI